MLLSKVCHWRWRLCDDTISWDIFQETSGCCFYHYCHYFPVIGSASRSSAGQKHCFSSGWKKKQHNSRERVGYETCAAAGRPKMKVWRWWVCGASEVTKTNSRVQLWKQTDTFIMVKWNRLRSENTAPRLRRFTVSGCLMAALQKQRAGIWSPPPPQPHPARSPLNPPLTSIITCHFIILLLCQISFPFRWLPGRTFSPPRDSGMN